MAVDEGKLFPAALFPALDLVIDDGHDHLLHVRGRGDRLQALGLALPLVDTGLNRAVGGQDPHPAAARQAHGAGGLPDHIHDGDVKLPLQAVHKVVGGIAGDGDCGAAAALELPGVRKKPAVTLLGVSPQDGRRSVRHGGIAEDEGGQVLLVGGRVGPIQNPLVKHLGGLRTHAAQNT